MDSAYNSVSVNKSKIILSNLIEKIKKILKIKHDKEPDWLIKFRIKSIDIIENNNLFPDLFSSNYLFFLDLLQKCEDAAYVFNEDEIKNSTDIIFENI